MPIIFLSIFLHRDIFQERKTILAEKKTENFIDVNSTVFVMQYSTYKYMSSDLIYYKYNCVYSV